MQPIKVQIKKIKASWGPLTLWTQQAYISAWSLLPVSTNGVFIHLRYSQASTVQNVVRNKNKRPVYAHMHLIQGRNKRKIYVCLHTLVGIVQK